MKEAKQEDPAKRLRRDGLSGQDVQTPSPSRKGPSRFKVGDRVRVNDDAPTYRGRIGTVTRAYQLPEADPQHDFYRYVVAFIEDGANAVYYDFELETDS